MGLKLAADAAVPFNYGTLPAGTAAVLGYVGGDTPHAWTTSEIAAAEKAVGAWWAIWTAPNGAGASLSAWQGAHDASGMIAALRARNYPAGRPVFYDVERHVWDASPSGARAAVAAWTRAMNTAGWARAYGYLPPDAGHGWIYDWVPGRPTSLPTGWIGQQYESAGTYDLSVFDESLWEDDVSAQDVITALSSAEGQKLIAKAADNGVWHQTAPLEGTKKDYQMWQYVDDADARLIALAAQVAHNTAALGRIEAALAALSK